MRARAAGLGLLVAVAGLAAASRGQPPRIVDEPAVTGIVLGPDGAPVPGDVVVVGIGTTTIDRAGRFRVGQARPGAYDLLVNSPGLRPYRLRITIPPSKALRLPVLRLVPAAYCRVRLVSPTGEPIAMPRLRCLSFDVSGKPMRAWPGDCAIGPADDGAVTIGPLPQGILAVAVNAPLFAQTRLPDLNDGDAARTLDGGTVVIQQPGAVLHVDVTDGTGAPVPHHDVFLDDARPRSPLLLQPVRTNEQGRATFEHLGPGRYLAWAAVPELCGPVRLAAGRVVALSGSGTTDTPIVVGGRATFRIASPLGPIGGVFIAASPNLPRQPSPFGYRPSAPACRGATDADGRVTLSSFPPGPARVDVFMANSTYVRQADVPPDGRDASIAVPDGVLAVHVVDAERNEPLAGAAVTWIGGGGRVEATATATGDALLEGVGTIGGTLTVSAPQYEAVQERLAEVPPLLHTVALVPAPPPASVRVRVMTAEGAPLPNASVALMPTSPAAVWRVAGTDAAGIVTFTDVPAGSVQLMAMAEGSMATMVRLARPSADEVVLRLSRGYRVIADVKFPAAGGRQLVRVINDAGVSIEDLLDVESDRAVDPPGRVSLGPLAPGTYAIVFEGSGGRTRQPIRIIDGDVGIVIR